VVSAPRSVVQQTRDLVTFCVKDLAYILRWPVVGHLTGASATRYARPPSPRDQVLIFLPGVLETWQFMRPLADFLGAHGYPVRAVHYLRHNAGPIREMAVCAGRFLEEEGLDDVIIVAHSKGGLIGKYLMANTAAGDRVRAMVTVNAPFSGSDVAHVLPMRVVRHFDPRHPTISNLNRNTEVNARITSICSTYDPLIRAHESMDGATNVALDAIGHFGIMTDPRLQAAILTVVSGGHLVDGGRI
jgi:triacylglycerol lipase